MKLGPIYGYRINDNEKPGGRKGSILRHGRYYLHFGQKLEVHWGWQIPSWHAGIDATLGEGSWSFSLGFLLAYFWFGIEGPRYTWWPKRKKETGINIHHGAIWWEFWEPWGEWSSKTPKWKNGNFDPVRFLLGKAVYSENTLKPTVPVKIPMPEGSYDGTVRIFLSTWKRPRWPRVTSLVRAEVKVPNGVPFPGKGENSWDCGEDASYGLTAPALTVSEAVGEFVKNVLRSREKYGGSVNWRPQEKVSP